MSNFQSFNSAGSVSSFSSLQSPQDTIRYLEQSLNEIHYQIDFNRQQMYNLIGFKGIIVTQSTINKDMMTIEKQFNIITSRMNQSFSICLKEKLRIYYDKILEQKNLFNKRMNQIRQHNICSPMIVKYALAIEKYFEIKSEPLVNQDEDDFDSLEIPSELY
ncbi:hypothetical protein TTHERM_00616700 (macronuclear) [Tetrahymena thermophila SB210]|uniref:Uncharacterized protein n=1 Tax=Tetrahymena thermophila (strain SB210) TaxID=312017 RepID=I7MIJ6_TETTS|nr:hypothetical protein TTHERM_00616700 [Tetrahymena thermophila SB210]EAS04495.2 hypothetical protein TTHERM_00616700 [Tetrahymena thermophila SB210]|eukprot:XP_001024740.2 hypothetical protein TTHERM_00616700 [Tetrahymena thermophila SB210]